MPQPAELHSRVASVVQQRQQEVAGVNDTLKRLQGEVGPFVACKLAGMQRGGHGRQ